MIQNGQKPTSLMTSLTKTNSPKKIFIVVWKTFRIFRVFEQLSNKIGRDAMQLLRQPKYA